MENVNPFNVFTYVGDIELYPESDNWIDTTSLNPIQDSTVEGNFLTTVREYNADQNGFSPIHWNAWKTTWTGTNTTRQVGGGEVAVVKVDNSNVELLILQPLQLQDRLEQVSDIE